MEIIIKFFEFLSILSDTMYTYILIPLLLIIGILYTIKIKGGQFTHLGHVVKLITAPNKNSNKNSISPFKAFTISAASHIGTGNIVGISLAISLGGPGAVFWMWIIALIGGASSFVENTLGQVFKDRNENGEFHGGPAFYIRKALKMPKLAVFFSIIVCITYGFMFNAMQANTISTAFTSVFHFSPIVAAIIIIVLTGVIIFGGLKRIADITSLLVPVMAILYLGLAIFILIKNFNLIPGLISIIFTSAFSAKAAAGGAFGAAILNGVRRGLFSNEAGMGAVPNASATADVSHPAKQGLIQAMGVYLDTIVVCSATAFIVILGGESIYLNPELKGLAITQAAIAKEVGDWAHIFLMICVFMFAFSSIIGNYYYGENNIGEIGLGKKSLNVYRVMVLFILFLGSVGDFSKVWDTGDVFMGFMALINLIVLFFLGKIAVEIYYDYFNQLKEGKDPVFHVKDIKSLEKYKDEITVWDYE